MVSTPQCVTSVIHGTSDRPCTTASLCMTTNVSWSPIEGNQRANTLRHIEPAALPVAGKILSAALDRAIVANDPRAANADERREIDFIFFGSAKQLFQHAGKTLDSLAARRLVVAVPPLVECHDVRRRQIGGFLEFEFNHTGTDAGAPDIDGENSVMASKNP